MKSTTLAALSAAIAGAISLTAATAARADDLPGFTKCYGISRAGQNSCASATGTHDCAGQSAADFSGQEWRATKVDVCTKLGGKLTPFDGVGHPTKS